VEAQTKNDAELVQQQLYRLHQSMGSSSDEITQLRVENEMLRIEVEERANEQAAFESKMAEVMHTKVRDVKSRNTHVRCLEVTLRR
jgi:hypothetical protein